MPAGQKKNNEVHYGYKHHVKCDADSKLITNYGVSDATLHDSQRCVELLEETDKVLYADSAYSGAPISENLPDNCALLQIKGQNYSEITCIFAAFSAFQPDQRCFFVTAAI